MAELSKIRKNGVDYDIKDTTAREEAIKSVKTVNGVMPDETGNIQITIPESGGNVALDPTLTQEGKAADAKATGDAINKLSDLNALTADRVGKVFQIVPNNLLNFELTNKYYNRYLAVSELNGYLQAFIDVVPSDKFYLSSYANYSACRYIVVDANNNVLLFSPETDDGYYTDTEIIIPPNGAKLILQTNTINSFVFKRLDLLNELPETIITKNNNLFDKNAVSDGFILNGTIYSESTYKTSDFIQVDIGQTYSFPVYPLLYGETNVIRISCFDYNKEYIGVGAGTVNNGILTITVSKLGTYYLRVTVAKADLETFMFVNGTYPEQYIPFGYSLRDDVDLSPKKKAVIIGECGNNPLYRKTVIFAGDSICHDSPHSSQGWASRIAVKNNMAYKNYGIDGSTITQGLTYNGVAKNSIVSGTLPRMISEYPNADYIIFEGGTNDADLIGSILNGATPEKFGEIAEGYAESNFDPTTFCGAVELLLRKAVVQWKGKKIGFIIAQKMGKSDVGHNKEKNNIRAYFETIIKCCEKWGVPYLNLWDGCHLNPSIVEMYDSSLTVEENETSSKMYRDGQHLTPNGYDYISPIIEAWMKTL